MARAVETCVHCGFCLPVCPTYRVLGEEMDSPRGRIVLMKQALEGELTIDDVLPHIDRCLGCVGCVTACPSGVQYGELLTPFRARAQQTTRPQAARLKQRILTQLLESPRLFRLALIGGAVARVGQRVMPSRLRHMLSLLPTSVPQGDPLPTVVPASGPRRARVALLVGCVQRVLAPSINHAAARVLSANGIEVIVPRGQACCGALAVHAGQSIHGRALAKRLIDLFPTDVDAVVTTAAGCGSAMKDTVICSWACQTKPPPLRSARACATCQSCSIRWDSSRRFVCPSRSSRHITMPAIWRTHNACAPRHVVCSARWKD